jgi:hypothetical protein
MNNVIKFTDEEMESIKKLQQMYQEKLIMFGQINIERISIEQAIKSINESENKIREEYMQLQKDETKLISELSAKYGDGTLSLKDGTFTPQNK